MADAEKWDEPDVRRDFGKTFAGALMLGAGLGSLCTGVLLILVLANGTNLEEKVFRGLMAGAAAFIVGAVLVVLSHRQLTRSKSVKVSGTWATKGGWRKRRL
ncbi:MAG TPA: hypothetical protein VI893_00625 [Thermoplasmata archaeon]|nr:hypothetical protein [Thermoplasmata archaeon]